MYISDQTRHEYKNNNTLILILDIIDYDDILDYNIFKI